MTNLLWTIFHVLVFPGLLFCVVVGVLLAGLDRKLVARMQNRVGPPLLQPWYDFLKCCGKETIIPRHARKGLFLAAPVLGFAALITVALFVPVFSYSVYSTSADLVVILYLLTVVGVSMIVGAAASGSPFAGVGLSREMVAMISYELPFVLVMLAVGRMAGEGSPLGVTFSLQAIVDWQAVNGNMLFHWSMIPAALAMLFVIPCEIGMHPFDIAEAETEICEGTLAEYSGPPAGLFRLTHCVKMYVMCALFCVLFLGGISTGYAALDALVMVVLSVVLTFVTMSDERAPRRVRPVQGGASVQILLDGGGRSGPHQSHFGLAGPVRRDKEMFQRMIDKSMAKSPWIFHINAGSCNGCDIELVSVLTPRYDAERLGFRLTGTPRQADIVVVSGPVTSQTRDRLVRTLAQVPEPRVVVSLGSCPRSGNVFKGSYCVDGPLEKYTHVDVSVGGCTPKPEAIMAALAKAAEILAEKRKEMRQA